MANGDKAAAKGWIVVEETDDVKVGFDDINYAMDRTADEVDRAMLAEAGKLDANKLIISTSTPPVVNGAIWARPI